MSPRWEDRRLRVLMQYFNDIYLATDITLTWLRDVLSDREFVKNTVRVFCDLRRNVRNQVREEMRVNA